ncbi:MAG: class I SAM-dependent methyltransferase [Thermoplasmataceae archaeon]
MIGRKGDHMNDFSLLDFEKLWEGREKVTMVEREVILSMIDLAPGKKVLEIGAGNGRITRALAGRFRQYYALDVTPAFLEQISPPLEGSTLTRICGDLYKMPFLDGSLDTIVMIRVFNFLQDPQRALREFARVLKPGGSAIISFFHTGSVATVIDRIKYKGKTTGPRSRHAHRVLTSNFEESFYSVAYFKEISVVAGFRTVSARSCGLEDYSPFAMLPSKFFVKLSALPDILSMMPHIFISIQKAGANPAAISRDGKIMACPECHEQVSTEFLHSGQVTHCQKCGHSFEVRNGVIYV